jgi:hypothetical protein
MRASIIAVAGLIVVGTLALGGALPDLVADVTDTAAASHDGACRRVGSAWVCLNCPLDPSCLHLLDP